MKRGLIHVGKGVLDKFPNYTTTFITQMIGKVDIYKPLRLYNFQQ